MHYNIVKLDKRHSWHDQFEFMLTFPKSSRYTVGQSGVLAFDRSRKWFNATYGWSQEVSTRQDMINAKINLHENNNEEINSHWSFSIDYNDYRIYVLSDKEVMFFCLSHPQEQ